MREEGEWRCYFLFSTFILGTEESILEPSVPGFDS